MLKQIFKSKRSYYHKFKIKFKIKAQTIKNQVQ